MGSQLTAVANKSCFDCPIRHQAVCARCDSDELRRLEQMKYYRTYAAGQTMVWSGDRMDFVASVISGVATLSQTLEDGRRQIVGVLLPSNFIGRPGRGVASYDVEATETLTVCCFRREPFERLLEDTPHIGERLLQMTMDDRDAAREWMLLLGRKTARERVASAILSLVRRDAAFHMAGAAETWTARLPLTREQMADYLGMTLETVSRQLSALKRGGLIRLEGARDIHVPNLAALETQTGETSEAALPP